MATVTGMKITYRRPLTTTKALLESTFQPLNPPQLKHPWKMLGRRQPYKSSIVGGGRVSLKPVAAAPEKIGEKVAESIKEAEEKCSENPTSGECAAAWDEVEELSAAASHARDRKKETDPLENFCKDNPETDECRTYDN